MSRPSSKALDTAPAVNYVLTRPTGLRPATLILYLRRIHGEVVVLTEMEELAEPAAEDQEDVLVVDQAQADKAETACRGTPLANLFCPYSFDSTLAVQGTKTSQCSTRSTPSGRSTGTRARPALAEL